MRVVTSMPHTSLIRTTTRASENVIDRERPSKLPDPVDEGSQPQAAVGRESCSPITPATLQIIFPPPRSDRAGTRFDAAD